jgi:LuxR family maltose regulon positive regulatory protein
VRTSRAQARPLNPVPAQQARLLLAQGDLPAAARWIAGRGLQADDEPDFAREPGHLVLARLLLAKRRPGARAAGPAARGGGAGPD